VLNIGVLNKYKNLTPQKYLIGVFVFLFSVLVGSLFSSPQANAITISECQNAGGTFASKYVGSTQTPYCNFNYSPEKQIKSYSYYNALSQCSRMGQWQTQVSATNASSPSKWLGTSTISVGYIVDADDGLRQCSTMIKDALDMWGYAGNYPEALEAFGYKKVDVPNCSGQGSTQTCNGNTASWVKSGDNNSTLQRFQAVIRDRVYQGATPTLEGRPDLLYLRGQAHLEKASACSATPYKKVSQLTAEEKGQYTNNERAATSSSNPTGSKDYIIVKLVNGTSWQAEDWVYKLPKDNWMKVIKLNEAPSGGSVEYTCVKIAKDMAGYADRVAADAAAMIAMNQDPSTKYAGIVVTPGGAGTIGGSTSSADNPDATASSCVIEGVGWIVCPVLSFMGGIVDGAYNFVSGLLVVQPLVTTGQNQGAYLAWAVMRNIANVAFVIAFLIIIFSQLAGFGVSNYGVKKLLPRLVIAAILVNVSFWVCAIAVDLSNIIGASVVQIFDSVGTNIGASFNGKINADGNLLNGGQWTNLVGGIIAGGAAVGIAYYVGLSALIPALLAAVVAIVTVFLVLTLRQALIILLIVVSPLAFVAYLLPNTEDLFTKWRKLFTTLLLMYPIIAGIFGASALASTIVMNAADGNMVVQIMGACIAILPLAITPVVMKTAGGILNRFGGIVNNTERGPVDRLKKAGAGYRATRTNLRDARALNGQKQLGRGTFVKWRSRRNAIDSGVKSERGRVEQQYVADAMTVGDTDKPTAFAGRVAGGGGINVLGQPITADPAALQRALAGAKFTIEKAEFDEIKAEQSLISNLNMDSLKEKLAEPTASPARAAAVIDRMIKIGEPTDYADVVNRYGNDKTPANSTVRQSIANSLRESGPQFLKASDLDNIATGNLTTKDEKTGITTTKTLSSMARDNIKQGVYSEEKLVSEAAVNIRFAFGEADLAGKQRMVDTAAKLKANPTLRGKIKHNAQSIDNLSEAKAP
jgi:hypothetical protein